MLMILSERDLGRIKYIGNVRVEYVALMQNFCQVSRTHAAPTIPIHAYERRHACHERRLQSFAQDSAIISIKLTPSFTWLESVSQKDWPITIPHCSTMTEDPQRSKLTAI